MRSSVLLALALVAALVFAVALVANSSEASQHSLDATGYAVATGHGDTVVEGDDALE